LLCMGENKKKLNNITQVTRTRRWDGWYVHILCTSQEMQLKRVLENTKEVSTSGI
jgi:hypothetical protein